MKKFLPLGIIAALSALALTNCAAGANEEPQPETVIPKSATNVEIIDVPGAEGFGRIVSFDYERDGQILVCTTKANYNSGVGCVTKTTEPTSVPE